MEILPKTSSGGEKASAGKNNRQKRAQSIRILEKSLIRDRTILGSKPWACHEFLGKFPYLSFFTYPQKFCVLICKMQNPSLSLENCFENWNHKWLSSLAHIQKSESPCGFSPSLLAGRTRKEQRQQPADYMARVHLSRHFSECWLSNKVLVNNVDIWSWPRTSKSKLLRMGCELRIHTMNEQPGRLLCAQG